MKQTCLFFILFIAVQVSAQDFVDAFSDGDFNTDPQWFGETDNFIVNPEGELQLFAPPLTETDHLYTAVSTLDSTIWEFFVRLDFNPSTSNFPRVYLQSDMIDLQGPLNGYYVKIGGESGETDAVELYRQTGTSSSLVLRGSDGQAAISPELRVRIIRDMFGQWELWVDPLGGTEYVFEADGFDDIHNGGSYLGVHCKYTSTRSDKFFFDDFTVDPVFVDDLAPSLLSANAISSNELIVEFDEPVNPSSSTILPNYSVDLSIGNPITAEPVFGEQQKVLLQFGSVFNSGDTYTLMVSGVEDLSGNPIGSETTEFVYFNAVQFDIVINEFFPDPSPSVGLPDAEFIELYNTTSFPIDLNNWTFSDASSEVTIPPVIIPPDSFVIVCNASVSSLFSGFGLVAPTDGFPTLNNTGDELTIRNSFGDVIHRINYTDSWYQDPLKDEGGWTIELKDPFNPCGFGISNWSASVSTIGGSPGSGNSIAGTFEDFEPPVVISLNIPAEDQIRLCFNEELDSLSAIDLLNYTISDGIGSPQDVLLEVPDKQCVILTFSDVLVPGLIYDLVINGVGDCAGNSVENDTLLVALPEIPERYDVLINEIMANPEPVLGLPGEEYLELYNSSDKAIDLGGWVLEDASSFTILPDFVILPGDYVIVCSGAVSFLFEDFGQTIGLSFFPSLNNGGDQLSLRDNTSRLVHYVDYSEDWYDDEIKMLGGYSLEMIDPMNPCSGQSNWKASDDPSGGTPGIINSVIAVNPDTVGPELIKAYPLSGTLVELTFSEPLDSLFSANNEYFSVDNSIGNPVNTFISPPSFEKLLMNLPTPIDEEIIYTVSVSQVADCSGNVNVDVLSAKFAIPVSADSLDIIINEILFNPVSGNVDFVEIYNQSEKVIDLQDFLVLEFAAEKEDSIIDLAFVSEDGCLIFPEDYIVLTEDPQLVKQHYYTPNPIGFIEVKNMPNFPDSEGVVVLALLSSPVIDKLVYTEQWHFPLLDDENGVSLERIKSEGETQNESNWHSASSNVGYSTPAYENSNFLITNNPNIGEVTVFPEIFSPDQDGHEDFLTINYDFDQIGLIANLRVYDSNGRLIAQPISNELINGNGFFTWDGTRDNDEKAPVGIYIIQFETFDLEGNTQAYKLKCVLAAKL